MPDALRRCVREIWRTCPYPADPASFADFLHHIVVGKLDPARPPWIFHQEQSAQITRNPASFAEAFRQIGRRKLGVGPTNTSRRVAVLRQSRLRHPLSGLQEVRLLDSRQRTDCAFDPRLWCDSGNTDHWVEIEVCGPCSDADMILIERVAQAANTRPVIVQRIRPCVSEASIGGAS